MWPSNSDQSLGQFSQSCLPIIIANDQGTVVQAAQVAASIGIHCLHIILLVRRAVNKNNVVGPVEKVGAGNRRVSIVNDLLRLIRQG